MADSLGVLAPVKSRPPGEVKPLPRLTERDGALTALGLRVKLGSTGWSSSSEVGKDKARRERSCPVVIGDSGATPRPSFVLLAERSDGRAAPSVGGRGRNFAGNGDVIA